MKELKAGIDNYTLYPLNLLPDEIIRWASDNGAEGVSFSGFEENLRKSFSRQYLEDAGHLARELDLFIEWGNGQHTPMDPQTFIPREIFSSNRKAAEEANSIGAKIIRSCSGGLMRWKKGSPSTGSLLKITASELKKQAPMLRDHGVILAIETHFEFTTFELLRLFEMCEVDPGDYLGVCLDTMNLLTMLEDPVAAAERILPWIVSTHIKDGGLIYGDDGITTFPAPVGTGIIDLPRIIEIISSTEKEISLSLEDHGGSFSLPVHETWFMERFPDLPLLEYNCLIDMAGLTNSKMGKDNLLITERSEWPSLSELRAKEGIRKLKEMRDTLLG